MDIFHVSSQLYTSFAFPRNTFLVGLNSNSLHACTCLQWRLFIQTTHSKILFQTWTLIFSSVSGLLNSSKGLHYEVFIPRRNNHCASRLHCNQCNQCTNALHPMQPMQPMHCTEIEKNALFTAAPPIFLRCCTFWALEADGWLGNGLWTRRQPENKGVCAKNPPFLIFFLTRIHTRVHVLQGLLVDAARLPLATCGHGGSLQNCLGPPQKLFTLQLQDTRKHISKPLSWTPRYQL